MAALGQPQPGPLPVFRARLSGRMVTVQTNVSLIVKTGTNTLVTNVVVLAIKPNEPIYHPPPPPPLPNAARLTYSPVEKRDIKEVMAEYYESRKRMTNVLFVEPPLPPGGK